LEQTSKITQNIFYSLLFRTMLIFGGYDGTMLNDAITYSTLSGKHYISSLPNALLLYILHSSNASA